MQNGNEGCKYHARKAECPSNNERTQRTDIDDMSSPGDHGKHCSSFKYMMVSKSLTRWPHHIS